MIEPRQGEAYPGARVERERVAGAAGVSRAVPARPRAGGTPGSVNRTSVPAGDDSTASVPPARVTRSRIPISPKPAGASAGSNPEPSSRTTPVRTPSRLGQVDRDAGGAGVPERRS